MVQPSGTKVLVRLRDLTVYGADTHCTTIPGYRHDHHCVWHLRMYTAHRCCRSSGSRQLFRFAGDAVDLQGAEFEMKSDKGKQLLISQQFLKRSKYSAYSR